MHSTYHFDMLSDWEFILQATIILKIETWLRSLIIFFFFGCCCKLCNFLESNWLDYVSQLFLNSWLEYRHWFHNSWNCNWMKIKLKLKIDKIVPILQAAIICQQLGDKIIHQAKSKMNLIFCKASIQSINCGH